VNPYVSFGLAMCLVVLVSAVLTGYLAVHFNRRARADLETALTPLAALIDGTTNLEKPEVRGKFQGQIAGGMLASDETRMGRVFHSWLIDAAGGTQWSYIARLSPGEGAAVEEGFTGTGGNTGVELQHHVAETLRPFLTAPGWVRVEYDPGPGHVRLTRPMRTRRDIPSVEQFERHLELLLQIGELNRRLQPKAI
jgi:hypothetical protein